MRLDVALKLVELVQRIRVGMGLQQPVKGDFACRKGSDGQAR